MILYLKEEQYVETTRIEMLSNDLNFSVTVKPKPSKIPKLFQNQKPKPEIDE
jgi:hypothetical protein